MKNIIFVIIYFINLNCIAQNLLNGPEDIMYHPASQSHFISNWVSGSIVCLDSNNNQTILIYGLTHSHGMMISGDTLIVATDNYIKKVNINTAEVIFSYLVPGASRLGHLTCDEDGIYYASDWSVDKIYKINPFTSEVDTLVSSGLTNPVGIMFDPNYSRLILCCFEDNSPVRAVDIQTGEVSEIAFPNIGSLDAITRDTDGNFYISSWSEGAIYKFDQDFLNTPEIISTGHNGPSGLEFFPETNILGVTNYNSNSISLIDLVVKSTEMKIIYNKLNLINYPNPFNPTTTINYTLKEDTKVILEIYNIKGQKVRTLVDKHLEASNHTVVWNGRNDSGKSVYSGIYFYKMKSGNYSSTKKMILLK